MTSNTKMTGLVNAVSRKDKRIKTAAKKKQQQKAILK